MIVSARRVRLRRTSERLAGTWQVVMVWGGLRGALSLVLALALPATVDTRPLIVALAAGAVMLSLVGHWTTMSVVLRRLRIVDATAFANRAESVRR